MKQYSIVGRRFPKIQANELATGKTKFSVDIKLSGMLHGKILRSPHPHAIILNIDVRRAEKLSGVKAIVTSKDIPGLETIPLIAEPPLARDKVRYMGEPVVAVAALDADIAEEALDLIKVEYQELPPLFDPEVAMQDDSPDIHQTESNIAARFDIVRGDAEQGFAEADFIAEQRFVCPSQSHACMEPKTCIASFDASGRLTIWSTSALIFDTRSQIARTLNLPENRVRVIQPQSVGGHFGSGKTIPLYDIVALLARKATLPVRIENTREEDFSTVHPPVSIIIELKMGVDNNGIITAKKSRLIGNAGAYYSPISLAVLNVATMRHENLYRFSNIKSEAYLVFTNKVPSIALRGFGNQQGHFALESMMDMLAEGIGMEPAQIRQRNAVKTGDTTVHGWVIRSCGLNDCIEKAAKSSRNRQGTSTRLKRGWGIGCGIHVAAMKIAGAPWTMSCGAFVKINTDGTVNLISGEGDPGQGASTVLAQICAEELGISMEDVSISAADTDFAPATPGPISSRTTTTAGNAVRLAAADAKGQLFQIAANKLAANIEDLEATGGKIYVRNNPERAISIAEIAASPSHYPILGRGTFIPEQEGSNPKTWYGDMAVAYSFAAQAAEVEVDIETGEVKVLSFTAAHDLGKAINPLTSEGQIEGGLSQGIGAALTEEIAYANGEVINAQFTDYKIMTTLDMPEVKSILVESNEPRGPFGAKGLGEIVLVPTAAAIANAIYNAVGVRITELPITPEKILRALQRKQYHP